MLRMKLSDLSYEIMREIVRIYDQEMGGNGGLYLNEWNFQDYALSQLRRGHAVEWRFGSKVSGHSKLWIFSEYSRQDELLIYFRFGANTYVKYGENIKLGVKLEKVFERAVDAFLKEKGLAAEEG